MLHCFSSSSSLVLALPHLLFPFRPPLQCVHLFLSLLSLPQTGAAAQRLTALAVLAEDGVQIPAPLWWWDDPSELVSPFY